MVLDSLLHCYFSILHFNNLSRFCYQAAACNAGNRLSSEVTNSTFCDMYGSVDSIAKLVDSHTNVTADLSTSRQSLELENIRDPAWEDFRDNVRPQLNWKSPARHLNGKYYIAICKLFV